MAERLTAWTYQVEKRCPACSCAFSYEKLLTRKVAARSRDWRLRNVYDELPGGMPDPLVYSLAICPGCTLAAVESDFDDARMKIEAGVRESAAHEGRALLKRWNITSASLGATRDLRTGLFSYLLADLWYRARSGPLRQFRIGWTAYRRAWLIEMASAAQLPLPWDAGRAVSEALGVADEFLEQGFVAESLPDGLYVGPDYGVNFGQEAIPYMIAAANYQLIQSAGPASTDRAARHARAMKFLSMALQAVSRSGSAELRVKIEDFRPMLKALEPGIASSPSARSVPTATTSPVKDALPPPAAAPASVPVARPPAPGAAALRVEPAPAESEDAAPAGVRETVDWGLSFEPLFARHGCAFAPGDRIVREGSADRDLYFILEGEARVTRSGGEEERQLAMLGRGAFFGEMSLLDGAPRFATVTATAPVRAIRIGAADFETIIRSAPAIALRIMEVLARRLKAYDSFVQTRLVPIVETTHVSLPPVDDHPGEAPAAQGGAGPGDFARPPAGRTLSLELESLVAEVRERGGR